MSTVMRFLLNFLLLNYLDTFPMHLQVPQIKEKPDF